MNVHPKTSVQARGGFTLVEMLVSIALVSLMMTLFTAVLQMATGSVKTQRKIAENDQKLRTLTTIIRGDIAKRTMRRVQPFFPEESAVNSPTGFGNRRGYMYVSTNNPHSGSDDILQFTMDANQTQQNTDTTLFFGHAQQLIDPTVNNFELLFANANQPDMDDGVLNSNSTASSSAAEVTYFIRHGNLYRRVLLLREPWELAPQDTEPTTKDPPNRRFFSDSAEQFNFKVWYVSQGGAGTVRQTNDFLTYFDFAAYRGNTDGSNLLGLDALSNDNPGVGQSVIAKPNQRFGFDHLTGRSREHLALNGRFMGRFLHAETSASNFNYPQKLSYVEGTENAAGGGTNIGNGNPMDHSNSFQLNRFGVIDSFDGVDGGNTHGRGGPRAVEDLLLANVHEMRIEVWDDRLQNYAPLAHTDSRNGVKGDYHRSRCVNNNAGPGPHTGTVVAEAAVFDSWHPQANPDLDGSNTVDWHELHPPFIAYTIQPPKYPDGPSSETNPSPLAAFATLDKEYWTANTAYVTDELAFASWTDDGDGNFEWGAGQDQISPEAFDLVFECVQDGTTGGTEPNWPHTPGHTITDGTVIWRVVDNRRPLQAIRITLRFLHQTSGDMRQLTLELPLVDET